MIKLSATRVSSFLQCPQKYWFNYIDRLPRLSNPAFKLGTACHEALEFAGVIFMKNGSLSKDDYKLILDNYNEAAAKEGIDDLVMYKEGKKLVENRINNFNMGKIVGVEFKFGFNGNNTTINDIPFIGAIDKLVEVDKDTLLVVDYKTSKTSLTKDQLDTDLQLSIYDIVARQTFPNYKRYILCLDYLKRDYSYTYRTDESRQELYDYLKVVYRRMTEMKKSDAIPKVNEFCAWCDFKGNCAKYKEVYENVAVSTVDVKSLSNEDLFEEWSRVKDSVKILGSRERELNMLIMEKIRVYNEVVSDDAKELHIRQNSNKNYDLDKIVSMIPSKDLLKLVNINKKSLTNYIADKPLLKSAIEKSITVNYSRPFLSKRNIRKK